MCRARGAGDSRSRIILMFNLVSALFPGLTPRALCFRALRALSDTFRQPG
jgi:hypothetical protein